MANYIPPEPTLLDDMDIIKGAIGANGTFTGQISQTTNTGEISLSLPLPGLGIYTSTLQGELGREDQGLYGGFAGNTGILNNSAKGTYATIYASGGTWENVEGDLTLLNPSLGYLYGAYSGASDDENVVTATGSAYRSSGLGQVNEIYVGVPQEGETRSQALARALDSGLSDPGLPIPALGSINAGGNFQPGAFSTTVESQGIETTSGRQLAVWASNTTGGLYTNEGSLATWYGVYGDTSLAAPYFMLGTVEGRDDLAGHLDVDGRLTYLDTDYLGTVYLWDRGSYDPLTRDYQSAGAGTFTLDPLYLSGISESQLFYYNSLAGPGFAAFEEGLFGSTAGSPNSVTMLGHFNANPGDVTDLGLFWGILLGESTDGMTMAGWKTGTWYAGENNGEIKNGKVRLLAIAPDGEGGQLAGIIADSTMISGFFYPGLNQYAATGQFAFTPIEPTSILPEGLEEAFVVEVLEGVPSTGAFGAGGSIDLHIFVGEGIHLDGHNWGVWSALLGGAYSGLTSNAFNLTVGGDFFNSTSGYWVGDINGTLWDATDLSGTFDVTAMSETALFDFIGDVTGNHLETGESGDWQAAGIGEYQIRPLDYYSYMDACGSNYASDSWDMYGNFGSDIPFWTLGGSPVTAIGTHDPGDPSTGIWSDPYMLSYNISNGLDTTLGTDYGAFHGVLTGINNNMDLEGLFAALAIDPSGQIGLITSYDLAGAFYPLGNFRMDGLLHYQALAEATAGIDPEDFSASTFEGTMGGDDNFIKLVGTLGANGTIQGEGIFDTRSLVDYVENNSWPWGIFYSLDILGTFTNPDNATTWTSEVGGADYFGVSNPAAGPVDDFGYFLGNTASSLDNNRLAADLEARFIALAKMGGFPFQPADTGMKGKVIGTYDPADETFEAVTGGTWVGEDNFFSSDFRTEQGGTPNSTWRLVQGTAYEESFESQVAPGEFDGYTDYEYFVSDVLRFGERWYDNYVSGDETGQIFLPTGAGLSFLTEGNPYRPFRVDHRWVWEPGTMTSGDFLEFPYPSDWVRNWYSEWDSNALAPNGSITGMLAGTDNPYEATAANPVDFGVMGTLTPDDPAAKSVSMFGVELFSSEVTLGAYHGFLGGLIDDPIGAGYALYIGPDEVDSTYQAGVLKWGFSGTEHPELGMWQAEGSVYSVSLLNSSTTTAISPADLNVPQYANENPYLDLGFMAGWLTGEESGTSPIIEGFGWGETLSLKGHGDWGIFEMFFGYDNYTQGSAPWTARIGGWAEFGTHKATGGTWEPDMGVWLTNPFSIQQSGNILTSTFSGEALTYSKWVKSMPGEILAYWDGEDNQWLGMTGGYWQDSQALAFNGMIKGKATYKAKYYYGDGDDASGSWYDYDYWEGTNSGWSRSYDIATNTTTNTEYYADGTTETWVDADGTTSCSVGTWDTSSSLLDDILKPEANGYDTTFHEGPFYDLFRVGWLDALAGGVTDLWGASQATPAPIRIIGEYDDWLEDSAAPPVLNFSIHSYNPFDGTYTIWDQTDDTQNGAYFGFGAGRALSMDAAEGDIVSLALNKNGDAGFIVGDWAADLILDSEMLEGNGSVYPIIVKPGTGYDDEDFIPGGLINMGEQEDYWDLNFHGTYFAQDGSPLGGDIRVWDMGSRKASVGGLDIEGDIWALGIRNSVLGGTYEVPAGGLSNYWELPVEKESGGVYTVGAYFSSPETQQTNGEWSNGKVTGIGTGAWVNWDGAVTGILGNKLKGTFDPNLRTWQAANLGAFMDTKTYVEMLGTAEGREKLMQLNMPFVQVGIANLTSNGFQAAGDGTMKVDMLGTQFLAYSDNSRARVFASDNVIGEYTGAPQQGWDVDLTGTSSTVAVGANFEIQKWNETPGNWGANINGSGTVDSKNVTFKGAAAGHIDVAGSGTFKGKGSGAVFKGVAAE